VRFPWSFAIISTRSFCHTPTQEYVVPKSIPTVSPSTAMIRFLQELENMSMLKFLETK
jgi:hypothetical protein